MTTYAILGATGSCGSALIDNLLRVENARIHAYCRDQTKLARRFPGILTDKLVQVFEGSIDDVSLLTACLRDCHAVFLAVSINVNIPGCSMAQTTAATVLAALGRLREERRRESGDAAVILPQLVLLSSASLNGKLSRNDPRPLHWILLQATSYVYEDLRVAEELLRAQSAWVTTIFIKPTRLSMDKQRGHALSLDEADGPLSYLDMAARMIEAIDDEHRRYDAQDVGVLNAAGSEKARFPAEGPFRLLVNLLMHFSPFLSPYLRYLIQ